MVEWQIVSSFRLSLDMRLLGFNSLVGVLLNIWGLVSDLVSDFSLIRVDGKQLIDIYMHLQCKHCVTFFYASIFHTRRHLL